MQHGQRNAKPIRRGQDPGGTEVTPTLTPAVQVASNRLALAAANTLYPAWLNEAGREGTFVFDNSDLSAKVTADTMQGIYVAVISDATGASGAWVRKFKGKAHSEWFGVAVAGTAAANLSAMNAALATLKATAPINIYSYPGSIGLETGDGQFDFSDKITLNHPLEFCGQLSGPYGGGGTVFRFVNNTAGIATSITGYGALVHGLNLAGAFTGTLSTTAHGLSLSAKIEAYNLRIEDFSGDGIHSFANGSGANDNDCRFSQIAIFNCSNGTYAEGGDDNASTFDEVSCFNNRFCGHRDKGFIGSAYKNGECAGNGNSAAFPTRCTYSGNCYAVAMDQETWCSTNAPSGTTAHNQGWIYLGASGIRTPATAWSSGLTWYFSAPLCGGNAGGNSASLFDAIYIEADQNPCIMQSPATVRDLLPPQSNFVLYPTGSNYDGYEFTAANARQIHGALVVGTFLTVGGTAHLKAGWNMGANPAAPDWGLYGIGLDFITEGRGQVIWRNIDTFANWMTLDATNGLRVIVGTIAAPNLSGTNTGDQFTAMTSSRILGRVTAGFGAAEQLTGTQATALLDVVASGTKGHAPASGGGTVNFLRADGAWAPPPSGSTPTVTSKTSGYTETATSGFIVRLCDLAAGFTVVLPTAVGNTAVFNFKKMQAAGSIIIDGNASETIDGGLTATLTSQYQTLTLVSDNSNWNVI